MLSFSRAALVGLATLTGTIVLAACSSDSPGTPPAPDAGVTCPATLVAALSSGDTGKCSTEGYLCAISFKCGIVPEQANCYCHGGVYECNNSADPQGSPNVMAPDTTDFTPYCKSAVVTPDACPTDEKTAKDLPCKNSGQQCFYTGVKCVSGTKTDVCVCKGSGTDAGLTFSCETDICP